MGIITRRNGRFGWESKTPRLDEMGESGVWLNIRITGPTDENGTTPVWIESIEHASTGKERKLDMPGRIECDNDEYYYLHMVFRDGLTTYATTARDGEVVRFWDLMSPDPENQDCLKGCSLHTAAPIRAFTYNEIYGSYR